MNQKHYSQVQVKNPSADGYTVKLNPRQGFDLILSHVIEDQEYEVIPASDFILLHEYMVDNDTGKETYCFMQKYNLEKWSKISNLFLGNIILNIKSTKTKTVENTIRLCVYLMSPEKSRVITVLNPKDHLLKIEANQIVQIVMFTEESGKFWSVVGIEQVKMDCIKTETVWSDSIGVYDPEMLFCAEPRNISLQANNILKDEYSQIALEEHAKSSWSPKKEYHFWTHLNLEALKKARDTKNGNYELASMNFVCRGNHTDGNGSYSSTIVDERKLHLLLSLRGNSKTVHVPEIYQLQEGKKKWNTSYISPSRQCIINPQFSESIDLSSKSDTLYVEIPHPSMYFNRQMDDAYWEYEISVDAKYGFKIVELPSRYINSIGVQRFIIKGIATNLPSTNLIFVGAVSFYCKGEVPQPFQRITLSIWRSTNDTHFEDRRTSDLVTPAYMQRRKEYRGVNYRAKEESGSYRELVELENLGTDCFIGVKSVALSSIELKTSKSTNNYSGYHGYDDDYFSGCGSGEEEYDVDRYLVNHGKKKTETSFISQRGESSGSEKTVLGKEEKKTWQKEIEDAWLNLFI